jgi:hypothetical protein
MDLVSLITQMVNFAFPDSRYYTAANRTAIINFLLTTPMSGSNQSVGQYLYTALTGDEAKLPSGYGYITWNGQGSLGPNKTLAENVASASATTGTNPYGTLADTDAGRFIEGTANVAAGDSIDTLFSQFASDPANGFSAATDPTRSFTYFEWSMASPSYAENAAESGKPVLAFGDSAGSNSALAQLETPVFVQTNTDVNGQPVTGFSDVATSSEKLMSFAQQLQSAANQANGTSLSVETVIVQYSLAQLYDPVSNTLAGRDANFWSLLSPDGVQSLAAYIEARAPAGQGDWTELQKSVLDSILAPMPEFEYGATQVASHLASSLNDALGVASLTGFAALAVANVVVTYNTKGAWAAALEAGEDGALAAGGLIFVAGISMVVAETVVPATIFELALTGANYGALVSLAQGVVDLQARITAFSNAPGADPTEYAPSAQLGNPLPSTPGQLIEAFNQSEVGGDGGNDTIQAYNVGTIRGGNGNDFITSTSAISSNDDDLGATSIYLGNGNNAVVASGDFNIYGGSGTNFVELPVGVADGQFNSTNWVYGGSANSSTL